MKNKEAIERLQVVADTIACAIDILKKCPKQDISIASLPKMLETAMEISEVKSAPSGVKKIIRILKSSDPAMPEVELFQSIIIDLLVYRVPIKNIRINDDKVLMFTYGDIKFTIYKHGEENLMVKTDKFSILLVKNQ